MKKKTLYLSIISIITAICIVIGLLIHVIAPAVGWLSDNSDELNDSGSFLSGSTVSEELNPFSSIDFDVNVSDVTIAYGDTYAISYKTNKKLLVPQYEIKDDTLYVKQTSDQHIHGLSNNGNCSLQITIPREASLKLVKGSSDVGDFSMEKIGAKTLDIYVNVGDIDISDNTFDDITIGSDVGDIDLDNVTFTSADLTSDVGDIDIVSAVTLEHYAMDLSCSIGDIDVNSDSYRSKYQQQTGAESLKTLTASTDTGDITVEY